jgi:hypothetical protein
LPEEFEGVAMQQAIAGRAMTADMLSTEAFWREFAADLHVQDTSFLQSQTFWNLDEGSIATLKEIIKVEGYFQLPAQQWDLPIARMAQLIQQLESNGLPLPFSFMYDEFWCLFFRLHKLIGGLIGEDYLRLPDFWTWLVDPRKDQSGWSPHRDKGHRSLFTDGSPKAVTIWIPLTDATTLNGCMYIVPADRDPTYGTPEEGEWRFKHADIRALPAEAGSVFFWNQAVLHWGSHANQREVRPRVSLAFEFQSANVPPYNQPLSKPLEIPTFNSRLKLIGKQILQYQHMYPLAPEVEALAKILSATPG